MIDFGLFFSRLWVRLKNQFPFSRKKQKEGEAWLQEFILPIPVTVGLAKENIPLFTSLELSTEWVVPGQGRTRDQAAWESLFVSCAFVHEHTLAFAKHMSRPTLGELKAAMAKDEYEDMRRHLANLVPAHRFGASAPSPGVAMLMKLDDEALLDLAALGFEGDELEFTAWMSWLARQVDAQVWEERGARMSAALPPPAPATSSTRGRF